MTAHDIEVSEKFFVQNLLDHQTFQNLNETMTSKTKHKKYSTYCKGILQCRRVHSHEGKSKIAKA